LDGFIARRYNLKTIVGSIIDPMADKALMTVLTVTLASQNLIPSKFFLKIWADFIFIICI
jgi:cardiolipin synthase